MTARKFAITTFPKLFLEIVRKYLRVEVRGTENILKKDRMIFAPNHSGCAGFDAAVLAHIINRETGRIPRMLTLWKVFEVLPTLGWYARKMGMVEATLQKGVSLLKKHQMVICFPEGENGSFKPSNLMYHLQKFHTGFVRMAVLTGAPIVPTIIIGAEESHINLGQIRLFKFLKHAPIPIPLNLLPLPVKWKIRFLPPIYLNQYKPEDAQNKELMESAANEIHLLLQKAIAKEIKGRKLPFFAEDLPPVIDSNA